MSRDVGAGFHAIVGGRDAPAGVAPDAVLDALPDPVAVVDGDGRLVVWNAALETAMRDAGTATRPEEGDFCCDLIGCATAIGLEGGCLADRARQAGRVLLETRVVPSWAEEDALWWVLSAPLHDRPGHVLFRLRPGHRAARRRPGHARPPARATLRILTLGRTRVETATGSYTGGWLDQRPGRLLKYLVAVRGRPVPIEEISEALWPGHGRGAVNNVRFCVHALRSRLDPARSAGAPPVFVLSAEGGYALDAERVEIDADRFEIAATAALTAGDAAGGRNGLAAMPELERAAALYGGDFLADEPYAEWAFEERNRLRELASSVLRALAERERVIGDDDRAISHLQRLAQLNPFDSDVHRDLFSLLLRQGRRTEAMHRYTSLRARLQREFGDAPDFDLADLVAGA